MQKKQVLVVLSLSIVILMTIAMRTFDYRNIDLDYDEHKTITNELRLVDIEHVFGYFTLRNMWDYESINKDNISINNSICFPLYYIPLKLVNFLYPSLPSLRLSTIIYGILSVFSFYALGNMFGRHIGWIAFALMLLHPWVQHHAVHIRFYELWALISILGLLYTESMIRKLERRDFNRFTLVAYGFIILLPCTIHAFGIINSLFLLIYTSMRIYYDKISLNVIGMRDWVVTAIAFILGSVIIGTNMAVFGYATLIEGQANDWNNSSSMIQIFSSFVFNAGYLMPLIIIAGVLIITANRISDKHSALTYITTALALSLLPAFLIIALKSNAFRSDYLYGILPYFLLIVALSIDVIAHISFEGKYSVLVKGFLMILIILSMLPTLVSNLFIDKDRLPHKTAAAEIVSMPNIKVFAPNPNYFNYYLGEQRVADIRNANRGYNDSGTDEYFYIPVRKGLSTEFFYDFSLIDGMELVRIIGKDRIDLRRNHIYVFRRRATAF